MHESYRLLLAGLAWGICTYHLLRGGWGIGVPVAAFLLCAAAGLAGLGRAREQRYRLLGSAVVVLGLAAVFAIRESWFARATALGAGFTTLAWAATVGSATAFTPVPGAWHVLRRLLAGTAAVASAVPPVALGPVPTPLRRVGRGLLLALPMALLFLVLFATADPVLAASIRSLTDVDLSGTLETSLGSAVWAWLGIGTLAALWRPVEHSAAVVPHTGRVESLTVATVLTVLFATAVAFQMRYLFGGDAYLFEVAELTRAEYARRGFFELLTITVLAMPAIAWLRRPRGQNGSEPALTGLLLSLVAMLGLILVSAAHRLLRYHQAFGLSEMRWYGGLIEVWLAGALVWLGVVVARGRADQFLAPVAGWGVALVLVAAVVNPAGLVQRANIARAARGDDFDVQHAVVELGADGRTALVAGLDRLPATIRCEALATLEAEEGQLPARDGFAWTWSRARARSATSPRGSTAAAAGCAARGYLPD